MSNPIDRQALREKAEAVTPNAMETAHLRWANATLPHVVAWETSTEAEADRMRAFLRAATPQAILALLDALDTAEQELRQVCTEIGTDPETWMGAGDQVRGTMCEYDQMREERTTDRATIQRLTEERDALRALLMTGLDIAAEAGAAHQSYDFKPRAQSFANKVSAALRGDG